jgi:hypothetical protein
VKPYRPTFGLWWWAGLAVGVAFFFAVLYGFGW